MMKRVFSLLAILLIILSVASLAACGGEIKIKSGTYQLTEISGKDVDEYAALKDFITLEVAEGGSAKLVVSYMDESQEYRVEFKDNDKVLVDNAEMTYTVSKDVVTINGDGRKMVFQK